MFGKTEFLWNGDVLLFENRNQIHKTYIYEPYSFRPLALIQDQDVYYYHLDHLGTPQEMTDVKGEIVWNVRYKAYGNVDRLEVERIENNLRFQGQYFDAETGLHYNRHRYYDPDAGRFIHQEPIGLGGGENLYLYVLNPVGWIDLMGLISAPSSLPNEPGIYIITNTTSKESYVGSAGIGKQGMSERISRTSHTKAQDLLKQKDTKVQYVRVDLGSATSSSDRNNILRHYEQREFDKQTKNGFTMLNEETIQAIDKKPHTNALIEEHGVSAKKRRNTC